MWRWVSLIVAIVGISAAIPLVVNTLPAETDRRGPKHPAPEIPTGPIGKLLIDGAPNHDFGKTSVLTSGKHPFKLKNVGEGDLKIKPGSTSCQCTVVEFDPTQQGKNVKGEIVLKPGESTEINVGWTPKNAGKFQQRVTITTSDPVQPEVTFTITGNAYPPLVTMPEEPVYELPAIDNEKPMTMYLAVSSFDEPSFKITEIRSTAPALLTASHSPLSEKELNELKWKTGYKVEIVLHPSSELGSFSDMLTIKTDHSGQNELQVPVRGRRTGAISAIPEVVRFNADQQNGGHNESLLLVRGHEGTTFEVAEKPANLSVRVDAIAKAQPGEKVQKYKIVADVAAGTPADVIRGDVVLKTNHPKVSLLRIPVQIPVLGGN